MQLPWTFTGIPIELVSVLVAVTCSICGYYFLIVAQKPRVIAGNAKMRQFLEMHMSMLEEKFYPSPLFWTGQLQTILAQSHRVTTPDLIPYTREIFHLSDGGEVALDFLMVDPESTNNNNTSSENVSEKPLLVLLLPGLTSDSQTSYMRTLVQSVAKAGASVVVQNHRGCGGIPFKSPKTYTGCYIGDLKEVAPYLKKAFPGYRIIVVGASLGGIVVSKYLITHPVEAKQVFECAILISILWDGRRGIECLERPFVNKYVINRALARALADLFQEFVDVYSAPPFPFPCDVSGAVGATTLREFDTAMTIQQYELEFPTVMDYYDCLTSVGHIHKYSIPVIALHADDDPTQPGESIAISEAEESDSKLAYIVTSRGGHLGWLEGITRKGEHYGERMIAELIQAIRLYGNAELCQV